MVCTFVTMQTRKMEKRCLDVMNRYCKKLLVKRKMEVAHNYLYEYGCMEMEMDSYSC